MNCHEAHDLLQQCLDGLPIESPEWRAHLRGCSECRALESAGRRLQEGLHRSPAPLPPPDLAERIAARIHLDRQHRQRRARRRFAISLALAAGLIIAVALRMDWRGLPTGTKDQPPKPVAQGNPVPQEKPAPTLRESAAEVGEVVAGLSQQTADETIGQTRSWVSNVPRPSWDGFQIRPALGPTTRPLREAGEGVSEGLKPVTQSARRAVNLFLRELPMETN